MRKHIKHEIEQTGSGPKRALKVNKEAKKTGPTSGIIYCVIDMNTKPKGTYRTINEALEDI